MSERESEKEREGQEGINRKKIKKEEGRKEKKKDRAKNIHFVKYMKICSFTYDHTSLSEAMQGWA